MKKSAWPILVKDGIGAIDCVRHRCFEASSGPPITPSTRPFLTSKYARNAVTEKRPQQLVHKIDFCESSTTSKKPFVESNNLGEVGAFIRTAEYVVARNHLRSLNFSLIASTVSKADLHSEKKTYSESSSTIRYEAEAKILTIKCAHNKCELHKQY